jgi:hypothetical protein
MMAFNLTQIYFSNPAALLRTVTSAYAHQLSYQILLAGYHKLLVISD